MPPRNPSEPPPIAKGCYAAVVETCDEWESLIGIVEDFIDAEGNSVRGLEKADKIVVFFPLSAEAARRKRLDGVNDFTDYVRGELRQSNSRWSFQPKNLEWFDPDEL